MIDSQVSQASKTSSIRDRRGTVAADHGFAASGMTPK
jgi:hypothetical protein